MFCDIGLQATTIEISSYMICQSYWKMYHWQSEYKCGSCMMVLRHILAVLCKMSSSNTYHYRWIGRGGPTAWPPRSPDLNPLDLYLWGHLETLVYAAPVDNEEAFHHRIVDACHSIRNYPGFFERMRQSMMRRVEACIESHGGHFEHIL
jgi:hypothetical protein